MKLNDICEVYSGYAFKNFNDSDGYPVIKIGNINSDGSLSLENCSFTTDSFAEKYKSKRNDLYIALSGATTGKVGMLETDKEYAINQRVGIVRSKDSSLPNDYIKYFLQSKTDKILQDAAGCAQPNISPKQLGEYNFPDISAEEMMKKSKILNRITKLINDKKQQLNLLDELVKARFVEMFGDVLNPKWEVANFEDEVYFQEGPGVRNWQFRDSGIKLINIKNVVDDKLCLENTDKYLEKEEVEQKYQHFLLNEGDYVMASSGVTWGKIAEVFEEHLPLCLNTSMIRLVPRERIEKKYLFHFIKSDGFRLQIERLITGSAQPNFGPSHLKKVTIPVPPKELQEEFSDFVKQIDKSKFIDRTKAYHNT